MNCITIVFGSSSPSTVCFPSSSIDESSSSSLSSSPSLPSSISSCFSSSLADDLQFVLNLHCIFIKMRCKINSLIAISFNFKKYKIRQKAKKTGNFFQLRRRQKKHEQSTKQKLRKTGNIWINGVFTHKKEQYYFSINWFYVTGSFVDQRLLPVKIT